ncbi:hypothetical protein BDP27DRAFT_1239754 [Rhodocollybia butyracea]|uniref:Uncharacterized protein n=1 Tax=Rhodocollybia butyracea TaxID=206335 RepID=A0A9P5P8L6_9AGAR|nr:hypothetical protein BDP27DRAFT_1239754 [Rhodocollybia butyracea]
MLCFSRGTLSHGPGDSIFTHGIVDISRGHISSYKSPVNSEECIASLEDCCEAQEACETQYLLRDGTHDLPQMTKVLQNQLVWLISFSLCDNFFHLDQQVFALTPSSTLQKYKANLIDELEPSILELVQRAQVGLQAVDKKAKALEMKLTAAPSRPVINSQITAAQKLEARQLVALAKQREHLEDDLKMLEQDVVASVSP